MIISTVETPTYEISKYLTKIIQPMLNKNKHKLINSRTFISEAKNWDTFKEEIKVSYDVVNLYPSIPIEQSITIVINQHQEDESLPNRTKLNLNEIKKLLHLCLSNCYFFL